MRRSAILLVIALLSLAVLAPAVGAQEDEDGPQLCLLSGLLFPSEALCISLDPDSIRP